MCCRKPIKERNTQNVKRFLIVSFVNCVFFQYFLQVIFERIFDLSPLRMHIDMYMKYLLL